MCNCKGNCDSGYCACVKINKLCDKNCNCPPTCSNILNNSKGNKKRKKYHETKLMSCNCKSRNCQTKYCICKKRNIKCTDNCNCCDCWNNEINTNKKITKYYKKQKKTKRKQSNVTFINSKIAVNELNIAVNQLNIAVNEPKIAANEPNIAVNELNIAANEPNIAANEPNIAANEPNIAANTFDNLNKYLNEMDYNLKLHDINLSFIETKSNETFNLLSDSPLPSLDIAEELLNINLF